MALESFATAEQMAERSQGAIAADHPYLTTALAAASRLIRNECRWHVSKVVPLTKTFRGWTRGVWLPAMQIASITEVKVDGVIGDHAAVDFDAENGWADLTGSRIEVKFTAGYAEHPADLIDLTLELAAQSLGVPLTMTREQAGGVAVTYTAPVLRPGDDKHLAAYVLGRLP